jgi:hypothetical protein
MSIRVWVCGSVTSLDGDIGHITLERAAIAMAHQNRFNGNFGPADLAIHSCRVAERVPWHLRAGALMHDIGEIVTGDTPKPLKVLAPELCAYEDAWRLRLCQHFFGHERGLLVASACEDPLVKAADADDYVEMIDAQRRQLAGMESELRPPSSLVFRACAMDHAAYWLEAMKEEIRG